MTGHTHDPAADGGNHELRRIGEGVFGLLLGVPISDGIAVQPEDLGVILSRPRPYFYVHVG